MHVSKKSKQMFDKKQKSEGEVTVSVFTITTYSPSQRLYSSELHGRKIEDAILDAVEAVLGKVPGTGIVNHHERYHEEPVS